MEDKMYILFKKIRNRLNLTREDICEMSKVSRSTISRFEDGKDIRSDSLFKIFNCLGYTLVPVLTDDIEVSTTKSTINNTTKKPADTKAIPKITKKNLIKKEVPERESKLRENDFELDKYDIDNGKIFLNERYYYYISEDSFFDRSKPIKLTRKEKEVLLLLFRNPNTLITYDDFKEYIWINSNMTIHTLRNKINSIRNKFYEQIITNHAYKGYELKLSSVE